ncbi:MAG TPA: hypothetical protein PKY86_08185, partial [Niabella sp.]|nr:hypothetical protein [Niabella sp.]
MKQAKISVLPLLAFIFVVFACNKKSSQIDSSPIYKAEIKQIVSCAKYYACVITNGDINPELVDNDWKQGDQNHQKSFTVRNSCSFPTSLKEGDSFYFQIEENP